MLACWTLLILGQEVQDHFFLGKLRVVAGYWLLLGLGCLLKVDFESFELILEAVVGANDGSFDAYIAHSPLEAHFFPPHKEDQHKSSRLPKIKDTLDIPAAQ